MLEGMNNILMIKAVVLAAGKGTRLQSEDTDLPKVMRKANNRPILECVLNAIDFIAKKNIIIVVGYKKEEVINNFSGYTYAEQKVQLGTGHAVMAARAELENFDGSVLICYGDMPVVKAETYKDLVQTHIDQNNDCTILSAQVSDCLPYGRIIRDTGGCFKEIVEDRDCTPEQKKITELNSGVYVFRCEMLLDALKKLNNNNSQGEYYLTDAPCIMKTQGAKIGIFKRDLGDEIIGVNDIEQLKQVEKILGERLLKFNNYSQS
jgi:UDP-N-acetylglucosamine diphosphorylase/glucosamine-1-phosphate N-acetyltransferase